MLFISHSTLDKPVAEALRAKLIARGYTASQIFLDSDEESGIPAGSEWEKWIYSHLRRCVALIAICSENFDQSGWCFAEVTWTKERNKPIFPVFIQDYSTRVPLGDRQAVFAHKEGDAAYERLFKALDAAKLGPTDFFVWDGDCPYPGLPAFDESLAGVYFGREGEIDSLKEQLAGMRGRGEPRFLMLTGGSGSGKSSLLKAGLLPRLCHPAARQDWIVLPVLRFGQGANDQLSIFDQLAVKLATAFPKDSPRHGDWRGIRAQLGPDLDSAPLIATLLDLAIALGSPDATVLIPIDQFEELLAPSAGEAAGDFIRFLTGLCACRNGRLLGIGTMRSDYLDVYGNHAHTLKGNFLLPFILGPFPKERIGDVILKPAECAGVEITDELLAKLKGDAPGEECLPLLAFTLEKLYRGYAGDKKLELHEYLELGGMEGSIQKCIGRVQEEIPFTPERRTALRRCFVKHLVQINDKGDPVRETARWDDLDEAAKPILEAFIRERLLIGSRQEDQHDPKKKWASVEVAHEALFRAWEDLKGWIAKSVDIIRWRQAIRRDRRENGGNWKGLTAAQLSAARNWPEKRRDELEDDELKWIEDARHQQRLKRWAAVAAFALVVIAAGIAWWKTGEAESAKGNAVQFLEQAKRDKEAADVLRKQAERTARRNLAQRLGHEARDLADRDPLQASLLAAEALEATREDELIVPEAMAATLRVFSRERGLGHYSHNVEETKAVVFDPGEDRIAIANDEGVEVHNLNKSGLLSLEQVFVNERNAVLPSDRAVVAFDGTGRNLITQENSIDPSYTVWRMEEGKKAFSGMTPLFEGKGYYQLVASPNGKLLAAASGSGIQVYDLSDISAGKVANELSFQTDDPNQIVEGSVSVLKFDRGSDLLLAGTTRGWVLIWDLKSGKGKPACFCVDEPDVGSVDWYPTSLTTIEIADDHRSLITAGRIEEVNEDDLRERYGIPPKLWKLTDFRPQGPPVALGGSFLAADFIRSFDPASGTGFLTVDGEGEVCLWGRDRETSGLPKALAKEILVTGEKGSLKLRAVISPDSDAIAIMRSDGRLKIVKPGYNASTTVTLDLQGDSFPEGLLAFSPKEKWLLSTHGGSFRAWHYDQGEANLLDPTRIGHTRMDYMACVVSQNSSVAALTYSEGTELWDLSGNGPPRYLSSTYSSLGGWNPDDPSPIDLSPDGRWFGSDTGPTDFTVTPTVRDSQGAPQNIEVRGMHQYSPDSHWLVAEVGEGPRLYDLLDTTGKPRELSPFSAAQFSPDSCHLLLQRGNWEKEETPVLLDLRSPDAPPETLITPEALDPSRAVFSNDGHWLFIRTRGKDNQERSAGDCGGYLWYLEPSGVPLRKFRIGSFNGLRVGAVRFSPDGSWMACTAGPPKDEERGGSADLDLTAAETKIVKLIRLKPAPEHELTVIELAGHESMPDVMEFSPDGECLLTATSSHLKVADRFSPMRLWDLTSDSLGTLPPALSPGGENCEKAEFSPNSEFLLTMWDDDSASGSGFSPVSLWERDRAGRRFLFHAGFPSPKGAVEEVAFSGDSRWLAVCDMAGPSLYLLFLPGSHERFDLIQLQTGKGEARQLEFPRDSSALFVLSAETNYEGKSRPQIHSFRLRPERGEVAGVKLKPSRGLKDKAPTPSEQVTGLRIYESDDEDLPRFRLHEDSGRIIVFGKDLHVLAMADRTEILSRLGAVAGRNLSLEEWKQNSLAGPYRKTFENLPVPSGTLSALGWQVTASENPEGPSRANLVEWTLEAGAPHLIYSLAGNLVDQVQGDFALRAINPLLHDFPDNIDYRFIRGVARAQTGSFAMAREDIEFSLNHDSSLSDDDALYVARAKQWLSELRSNRNPFANGIPKD